MLDRSAQDARAGRRPRAARKRGAWLRLNSTDFAKTLSARVVARSPHFVLHHLAAHPTAAVPPPCEVDLSELSTGVAPTTPHSVDNNQDADLWWLGLAVPKRYARRAVTRTLIKRQMRQRADLHRDQLPPGRWAIRLRALFVTEQFASAASTKLREAVHGELERLFAAALRAQAQ